MRLNIFYLIALGILLLITLAILFTQLSQMNPIYSAIGILMTAMVMLGLLVIRLTITQKTKAKGAKKRRQKLLPMFYKRKKKK